MARRLADEKFVFEAKVRIDDFMDRLGLEQETLIFCPVQDKKNLFWSIAVTQLFLTVKGAAATTWTIPVEARALMKASYDDERGIQLIRRV